LAVISKVNSEVVKALKTSEFQERLSAVGAEAMGTTSAQQLDAFTRAQAEKMRNAVKESGARPDT
jgi:tripartite-type tricarboxylate transporter receptor subunit TctC